MPELYPGDLVRRKKWPVWHWGVYVGENLLLHNMPGVGEHVSTVADFADGKNLEVFRPSNALRSRILIRAHEILEHPERYSFLWRNCEHTVSEAATGDGRSETVVTLMFILLTSACLAAMLRRGGG